MKMNKTLTALVASATMGLSGQAMAAGTPAGSQVTNTVTLDYSVSGTAQNQIDDSTQFIVDNKIDMTFTTALTGASTVIPGADLSPTYTLQNDSNDSQSFRFTLAESTNQFDAPTLASLNQVSGTCSFGVQHQSSLLR